MHDLDEKRRALIDLVDELLELEQASMPAGTSKTIAGKHERAERAKMIVHQLARLGAGWAFDHLIGIAIAELDVGLQPDLNALDTHEHQLVGGSYDGVATPRQVRLMLSYAGGIGMDGDFDFNPAPFDVIRRELQIIERGAVSEIFAPEKADEGARKRRRTARMLELEQLRFFAIRYVECWSQAGRTKVSLREDVVRAYGLSPVTGADTVKNNWRLAAVEALGDPEYQRMVVEAQYLGRDTKRADHIGALAKNQAEAAFGETALKEAGAKYRELERHKGGGPT